jgi:hypothetical protein
LAALLGIEVFNVLFVGSSFGDMSNVGEDLELAIGYLQNSIKYNLFNCKNNKIRINVKLTLTK